MALKIAFIRYKYDPFGGAERFTQNVMNSLAAKGLEIHLFARRWAGKAGPGVVVHRVGGPTWPFLLAYASFVFLVGKAVRRGGYDLVQSNERTLCQDVYRAGDGVHARWLELRRSEMGLLRRLSIRLNPSHLFRLWLEKRMFEDPRLKAVVVNSEMVRREILSLFRISNERIRTIYNGVDLQRFHPENRRTFGRDLRAANGISENTPVVLFVGSGFDRKGLRFAMEGLARTSGNARLWVVGKGRSEPYRNLAAELGISGRTTFFGPSEHVMPFYAAADTFILPTLYDPFPTVVLEAMASGLPVITTAQCGASEIIRQGREGFVLPRANQTDLMAEYLEELFCPERRKIMAAEARSRAEEFPLDRTVTELEALYEEILHASGAGNPAGDSAA